MILTDRCPTTPPEFQTPTASAIRPRPEVSTYCLFGSSVMHFSQKQLSLTFSAGAAMSVLTQLFLPGPELLQYIKTGCGLCLDFGAWPLGCTPCSLAARLAVGLPISSCRPAACCAARQVALRAWLAGWPRMRRPAEKTRSENNFAICFLLEIPIRKFPVQMNSFGKYRIPKHN